ncbi:hypothetical protein [Chryseobacterium gregarium]|uniref:hypothetical protein n=1 Tax=Chryseobacterium gregarium TaxID=456299 RepID=UPI0004861D65|nr:hypothetical protein [Chryseobacterium gregarium]
MITEENLKPEILNLLAGLLRLADRCCWNKLSPECFFIITDFNEFIDSNGFENHKLKNKINSQKALQDLDSSIELLKKEYADLYDIVLYVFKAGRHKTVIEIEYYRKSNFDPDYFEKIKNNPPMLHAKIHMPPYGKGGKKFDVNWKRRGWRHRWNMLVYNSRIF